MTQKEMEDKENKKETQEVGEEHCTKDSYDKEHDKRTCCGLHHASNERQGSVLKSENAFIILLVLVILIVGMQSYTLSIHTKKIGETYMQLSSLQAQKSSQTQPSQMSMQTSSTLTNAPNILPKGVPKIYGKELDVRYDDISASAGKKAEVTTKKLGAFDEKSTLTGDALQRYIKITSNIGCEYCCGATALILADGSPACGCAHSYAMRGLAKYLITNHPKEFTDDEILEELGKWKTLFFPAALTKKAKILSEQGIELNYINLASNKYRGAESKATASSTPVTTVKQTKPLDTTGWSAQEKMEYEHHGIIPKKLQ